MSKPFDEIANEAAQLPRELRLNLANILLELDESDHVEGISAVWEQEILARIRAVDEGTAKSATYEEVMRAAEDRLTS
jgi:hypothetical protein